MGGYGSGRSGGRPTIESALRLDIDAIRRWGVIRPGAHLVGEMTFNFYGDKLRIDFESRAEEAAGPISPAFSRAFFCPKLLDLIGFAIGSVLLI
jgi:hypothetical protein